jgi:enoyl-CoA hydratase/carnithine racemase
MKLSTEKIIAEKEEPIGWLKFNNPERRNAISLEMWQAIPEVLDNFESDPDIRVIVVTGVGNKAFAAGADISEFEEARSSAETVAFYAQQGEHAFQKLATTTKPTLAMIHGFCVGGGVAVALSCDIRLASEEAKFSVPAAKLGLGYGQKNLMKLVDAVGPAFTKEILFTARLFSAGEALGMGLVNRVLPDNVLADYVRSYGRAIAENAPLTMRAVKRIIAEITNPDKPIDHALCDRLVQECFDSEDYAEGRRAFMEKRKPVFRGR